MIAILKNRHVRDTSFQAGFVGALIILIVALVVTGKSNLEAQGLTSGFDFLERSTGWRISFSLIDYTTSSPYWLALVVGLLNSVFLGAISLSFATFIGVAVGVMRTSGNGMAELIGTTFVEIFRNVPLILQLLFWYSLLLSLPSPRDAEPVLGVFAFTGRGIYIPGLNITGLSVFLIVLALVACASVSLWLSTADRFKAASVAVRRKWKFYAWIVTAIVVIATIWWGRLPETAFLAFRNIAALTTAKVFVFRRSCLPASLQFRFMVRPISQKSFVPVLTPFLPVRGGRTCAWVIALADIYQNSVAIGDPHRDADPDQPVCLAVQGDHDRNCHQFY